MNREQAIKVAQAIADYVNAGGHTDAIVDALSPASPAPASDGWEDVTDWRKMEAGWEIKSKSSGDVYVLENKTNIGWYATGEFTRIIAVDPEHWQFRRPAKAEPTVIDQNVMAKMPDGHSYRCECGCNVFHKLSNGVLVCNACWIHYSPEYFVKTAKAEPPAEPEKVELFRAEHGWVMFSNGQGFSCLCSQDPDRLCDLLKSFVASALARERDRIIESLKRAHYDSAVNFLQKESTT